MAKRKVPAKSTASSRVSAFGLSVSGFNVPFPLRMCDLSIVSNPHYAPATNFKPWPEAHPRGLRPQCVELRPARRLSFQSDMSELVQIGSRPSNTCAPVSRTVASTRVLWLQGFTVAWMLLELGVSAYAASTAHSPAIMAFGADSLVEVLSAAV